MDFGSTGLSVSSKDAKFLVNEAHKAFLFVNQQDVSLYEFEGYAKDMMRLDQILIEEPIQRDGYSGKVTKGIFHDGKEDKVVWFAYLGGPEYVIDIKGGYPASKDAALQASFLAAFRSVQIDNQTVLTPFDGLPYKADLGSYGYTKEVYLQPNTVMLRREVEGGKRLILMHWFDKNAEIPSPGELQHLQSEVIREKGREITFWWDKNDQKQTDEEITFRAIVRFENNQVEVLGYGPWSSGYLEELKSITRSVTLQP